MSTDPYCYLDGKIARLSRLRIAPNDLGILRAYGIFDYLRTVNGRPVLLDEHITRFMRSAKGMQLNVPVSVTKLKEIIRTLIRKNAFKETSIKFVLTGGPSEDGITITSAPTFYVLAGPAGEPPEARFTKGIALQTYEYMRLLPRIKTINYIVSLIHQKELKKKGVLELLYVYKGNVLECSSSNVFIVKKNKVITSVDDILLGTVRARVLALAKGTYLTEERRVTLKELYTADEVFITGSNKSVMPVVAVDGKRIGTGKVGPVAKELRTRLEAYYRTGI